MNKHQELFAAFAAGLLVAIPMGLVEGIPATIAVGALMTFILFIVFALLKNVAYPSMAAGVRQLRKLFRRHKSKKLDIGSPKDRFCVFCGHKKSTRRYSCYDAGTGDEAKATWQYHCFNCDLGYAGWD